MFFKTFDSESNRITNKIGVFNKSFRNIGRDYKSGNGLFTSLFSGDKITSKDISSITAMTQAMKNGSTPAQAWYNNLRGCSVAAKQYVSESLKAGKSTDEIVSGLTNLQKTSKAAAIGMKALSIASNMLISMAVIKGIELLATSISDYVNAAKIARENTEALSSSLTQSQNKYAEDSKKIKELSSRYETLSEGVNHLGQNVSLSSSQYDEYKSIIKQLSEIMPDLTLRFNEQGEAIGFVGGKLKDVNGKYQEYQKNQATKFLQEGDSEGKTYQDALSNLNENLKEKETGIKGTFSFSNLEAQNILQSIVDAYQNSSNDNKRNAVSDKIREISKDYDWLTISVFSELIDDGFSKVNASDDDELNQYIEGLIQRIEIFKEKYEYAGTVIRQCMTQVAASKDEYWNSLDNDGREKVTAFLSGITTDFLGNNNLTSKESIGDFVDDLISSISENKDGISDAFGSLFTLNIEDMDVDDARTKIQEFCTIIANVLEKSLSEVQKILGYDDFFKTASNYDKTVAYASDGNYKSAKDVKDSKGFNQADVINAMKENSINTDEEIDKFKEILDTAESLEDAIKSYAGASTEATTHILSFSEAWKSIGTSGDEKADKAAKKAKDKLLELAEAGKLTAEAFNKSSIAENFLNQTKLSAEEATQKINELISSADQLASMKTGISSISSVLGEKKENLSSKKTKTVGIGADTLAGMPDDIKKQKKEYEDFAKVLGDGTSSMDECRSAANKLATAYVNSNNFLSNLTAENEDYYKSVLKEMGVENAAEVVTAALNRQKVNAKIATFDMKNATEQEISTLGAYVRSLDDSSKALAYYTLQQQIASNNALDTSDSVKNLMNLAKQCGITGEAISLMTSLAADMKTVEYYTTGDGKNDRNAGDIVSSANYEVNGNKNRLNKVIKKGVKVGNSPKVTPKSSSSSKGKSKKDKSDKSKSKQVIDWIDRALTQLSSKLDLVKTKYENLFISKKVKNSDRLLKAQTKNLNDQYKILKKTEKYQKNAEKKYIRKANSVKLSSSLKKAVRNGRIKGSMGKLIATYGEKKADQIQKYQDWYDKAQEQKKARLETKKAKRENRIQKVQLRADNADSKKSLASARRENAFTAKTKNWQIGSEIKYTKKSYDYQIKIAKLEKDTLKVKQLQAEKTKEIRDLQIEQHQNIVDEHQASLDNLAVAKELQSKALDKNSTIEQEKDITSKLYAEKIAIANLEGDAVEAAKLKKELEKEIRDKSIEQHENLEKEYEATIGLLQAEQEQETIAQKRNELVNSESAQTKNAYAEKIEIARLEGNTTEELRLQLELQKSLIDLEHKKFENISHYYENLRTSSDNIMSDLSNQIAEMKADGATASEGLYRSQISTEGERLKLLQEERADLESEHRSMEQGTDAWYEQEKAIQAVEDEISQCRQNMSGYLTSIREAKTELRELYKVIENLNKGKLDNASSYLSRYKLTDDDVGGLTSNGIAQLGIYKHNIENAKSNYNIDMERLSDVAKVLNGYDTAWGQAKQLEYLEKNGFNSFQEAVNEYNELSDKVNSDISDWISNEDNIISLMKERYNSELAFLKKLIDARKDLLSKEKEQYDYQKSVRDKVENITSIQKQLEALRSDGSEEARVKSQQLQSRLDDAKEELFDVEYDKYISDQGNLLDDFYSKYEAAIEDMLADVDTLLAKGNEIATKNGETIKSILDTFVMKYKDPTADTSKIVERIESGVALSPVTSGDISDTKVNTDEIKNMVSKEQADNEAAQNVISMISGIGQVDLDGEGRKRLVDVENAYNSLTSQQKAIVDRNGGLFTIQQKQKEYLDILNTSNQQQSPSVSPEPSYLAQNPENINAASRDALNGYIKDVLYEMGTGAKHCTNKKADGDYGQVQQRLFDKGYKREDKPYINKAGIKEICKRVGIAQNEKSLLAHMNNIGFSQGGLAEVLQKVPGQNGDDGWVTVKRGEAILTPIQTEALMKFKDSLVPSINLLDNIQKLQTPNVSPKIANNSVDIQNIDIHLDGSNIFDKKTFIEACQRDNVVRDTIKHVAYDELMGKGRTRINMIR